ncbi:unnamed protein product [Polarella glacialis]|uniref:RNase H type-1 domain-containing protein n=1 Tax=Polarella glacialis TaxID=89957 RepID=A0A813FP06_POLGL|nr:unnamed protein product [Polarella glacialis]
MRSADQARSLATAIDADTKKALVAAVAVRNNIYVRVFAEVGETIEVRLFQRLAGKEKAFSASLVLLAPYNTSWITPKGFNVFGSDEILEEQFENPTASLNYTSLPEGTGFGYKTWNPPEPLEPVADAFLPRKDLGQGKVTVEWLQTTPTAFTAFVCVVDAYQRGCAFMLAEGGQLTFKGLQRVQGPNIRPVAGPSNCDAQLTEMGPAAIETLRATVVFVAWRTGKTRDLAFATVGSVCAQHGTNAAVPVVSVCLPLYSQHVQRVVRHRAFPISEWRKCPEEDEVEMAIDIMLASWAKWLAAAEGSDVEKLWKIWCDDAEAYLLQRALTVNLRRCLRLARHCEELVRQLAAAEMCTLGAVMLGHLLPKRYKRRIGLSQQTLPKWMSCCSQPGNQFFASTPLFLNRRGSHSLKDLAGMSADDNDLTGKRLQEVLRRMRSAQACGMEGWRVSELRALPLPLLDRLAEFFVMVERSGKWPRSLERALITLIPKGDSARPADMRLIFVMSAIYRLWAAARLQEVKVWQEMWVSDCQHGYRPKHGAEDVYWSLALRIEDAILRGIPLVGVSFDYSKCCDRIHNGIQLRLVRELGIDERISSPVQAMYANLRRRFRINQAVGQEFAATKSILQGCPLSVVFLNALVSIWSKAVAEEVPDSVPDAFAAAIAATASTQRFVQQVVAITEEFSELTGQTYTSKSFSTAPLSNGYLRRGPLPVVTSSQCGCPVVHQVRTANRCAEIVLTLFATGHRCDLIQASTCQTLLMMRRMLVRQPDLQHLFERVWARQSGRNLAATGRVHCICAAAEKLGWNWSGPKSFVVETSDAICPLSCSSEEWEHIMRESARKVAWRRAAMRRADMNGIQFGIEREATTALLSSSRLTPLVSAWPECLAVCGLLPAGFCSSPAAEPLFIDLTIEDDTNAPAVIVAAIVGLNSGHPAVEICHDNRIVIYTDGACRGNLTRAIRRAGVGVFWGIGHRFNINEPLAGSQQTNQRAELFAVIRALETDDRCLETRTDSKYVYDGCRANMAKWKVKGHAKARDILSGATTAQDKAGNADELAVAGAAMHAIMRDGEVSCSSSSSSSSDEGCMFVESSSSDDEVAEKSDGNFHGLLGRSVKRMLKMSRYPVFALPVHSWEGISTSAVLLPALVSFVATLVAFGITSYRWKLKGDLFVKRVIFVDAILPLASAMYNASAVHRAAVSFIFLSRGLMPVGDLMPKPQTATTTTRASAT